jgi:uncharacterized DUF497 family protein
MLNCQARKPGRPTTPSFPAHTTNQPPDKGLFRGGESGQSNLEKHGVDFVDAVLVLAAAPLILEDMRRDYGEQRCLALGELRGLLFAVTFTIRNGAFRLISARRANARERSRYEARIAQDATDSHDSA